MGSFHGDALIVLVLLSLQLDRQPRLKQTNGYEHYCLTTKRY
jgi:hypothetical protein